jgi:hypothetical protein
MQITTNPWGIPPIPWRGDASPERVHEARSRALDAWEQAEVCLSMLDHFMARSANQEGTYGTGVIFRQRLECVNEEAIRFFVRFPSQDREADFACLMDRFRKYAERRHDIAHGTVQPLITLRNKDIGSTEFALLPAYYTVKRKNPPVPFFPSYAYTSDMLREFERKFEALREETSRLSQSLFPWLLS